MVAILGSVFMVAGIIQTLLTTPRPEWLFIFPYNNGSSPSGFLGLAFTLLGVTLFLGGITLAVHYGAQRVWYSNALKEGYRLEEDKLRAKRKNPVSPLAEVTKEVNPLISIPDAGTECQTTVETET
jgi:hypothetical protein